MNVFGTFGLITSLGLIVGACLLGGAPDLFINIPSIALVGGITLGLQLSTVGTRTFLKTLRALLVILVDNPDVEIRQEDAMNLRAMARQLHAAGAIGVLIGSIQILASIDDWSVLGLAMAVMLLPVLYALVLADCVVRPCAARIEYQLARKENEEG
jgi:flagellar motor component MotA